MKYLLDTQLLLWAAQGSDRLSPEARKLIEAEDSTLVFSAASVWEIAIQAGLGRDDFVVDPGELRRGLLDNGYQELPVTGAHAAAVMGLAGGHKDPFDRMLLTQVHERLVLATADAVLAGCDGPIVRV